MLRKYKDPLGHWNAFFGDFATSPLDFYKSVEAAVAARGLPDVTMSRVEYREAGVLSDRREYLRVRKERLVFDVCAAPNGKGFFFSRWFLEDPAPWGAAFTLLIFLVSILGIFLKITSAYLERSGNGHPILILGLFSVLGFWIVLRLLGKLTSEEEVLGMPVIGSLYERIAKPVTYFRIDTQEMFRAAIHAAILECVDGLHATTGLRSLAPEERVPVLRKIMR